MLDIEHILPRIPANCHNVYTVGSICGHNVVIACLGGSYGTTSVAELAAYMMSDFKFIKIPLMVGIGGGVPTAENDIRLGDVVISFLTSERPAVVQYDFGKTGSNGVLIPKGYLNMPKDFLLKAGNKMKSTHQSMPSRIPEYISGSSVIPKLFGSASMM